MTPEERAATLRQLFDLLRTVLEDEDRRVAAELAAARPRGTGGRWERSAKRRKVVSTPKAPPA
jgi:hypothetical protein